MNTRSSIRRKECSICYETLHYKGQINSCSHEFCFECISKWSEVSWKITQIEHTCPVCRGEFTKIKETHPLGDFYDNNSQNRKLKTIDLEERELNILLGSDEVIPFMVELFRRIQSPSS